VRDTLFRGGRIIILLGSQAPPTRPGKSSKNEGVTVVRNSSSKQTAEFLYSGTVFPKTVSRDSLGRRRITSGEASNTRRKAEKKKLKKIPICYY
jgi:hypothetical protein